MNAERDVERLLSGWLAEEAEVRAPDRVLESARRTVDRTLQRRWVAVWRKPVTLTATKVAALAAALVIALSGAAWLGRASAPGVGGPGTNASPSPAAPAATPAVTLETYRAARDEICIRYRPRINPLKLRLESIYDAALPDADRAEKTAALVGIADGLEALRGELAQVPPPPEIAAAHARQIADYDAIVVLIREALGKLQDRDFAAAERFDLATDAFSIRIEAFEDEHELLRCP